MLCAACSPKMQYIPVAVSTPAPEHLLIATQEPVFAGESTGDLLEYALEVQTALRTCNADKKAASAALHKDK